MYDSRMAAAAVQRMRARPRPPPPAPPLTHRSAAQDRRRIPLEGRRRTREWLAHQAFLRALEVVEARWEERVRSPFWRTEEEIFNPSWLRRDETFAGPATDFGDGYIITVGISTGNTNQVSGGTTITLWQSTR